MQSAVGKQHRERWKVQGCCYGRVLPSAEREMEAITLMRGKDGGRDEGIFPKFSQRVLFDSRARKRGWKCRLCSLFFPNSNLESSELQGAHVNLAC